MRRIDILKMAIHNLRQRKARTLLNLLGIVVGCIVLLMTAAGVRGVKNAIQLLFDASESARQIGVIPSDYPTADPPEEAIVVEGKMSDERRDRLRDKLIQDWRSQNRIEERWELSPSEVERLEAVDAIRSVVPRINVPCSIKLVSGKDATASSGAVRTSLFGIDEKSSLAKDRVIAGMMLGATSRENADEALIHEYTAYQLGYRSDADLEKLVGQTVELEYTAAPTRSKQMFKVLLGKWDLNAGEIAQQGAFLGAVRKAMSQLDKTSLSDSEKAMLKSLFVPETAQPVEPTKITRRFVVSGVIMEGDASGIASLFRGHWQAGYGGVALKSKLACSIWQQTTGEQQFYDAVVTVDSTSSLSSTTDMLEKTGARTLSAVRIIESMNARIDESGWVVYGIAAAILLTAAIGISNTLLVSVLERTPEFGIMKAVGARDSTLLWLMVCEGAILGAIGALLAVLISFLVGALGHRFLQMYLEYRLGGQVAATLFEFGIGPILTVFAVSTSICIVASLFPAWRAARLDPIVAMQRS
ncbi:MAG: hypothetical protein Aurels2KO_01990 [Aureliella sp.]